LGDGRGGLECPPQRCRLVGTMDDGAGTRRVWDDACATGHATGHEPRGKLGSLSTSRQYPRNSHALYEVRGTATLRRWTLFGSSSARVSAASLKLLPLHCRGLPIWEHCVALLPSLFGSSGAFSPRSIRLDSGTQQIRIRLGVAIRHSYSYLHCILIQGRFYITTVTTIFISLSPWNFLSTQLNFSLGQSLFSYTYSVTRDARLHARTQGLFYFSVLYCTVLDISISTSLA